ncbi:kinase-like domain-containing protein [Glomus cerebriforme]|uniref:Kinase-like domain-containing protein n=1 Tax=Glomus cerebriforme TaxID=658196 RepID=A0A397S2J0_9GLOM|nr:kinase-like domain-containing protein [Glomus cerebriforme]
MAHGTCKECNQENTGFEWCKACNANRFQQNFKNWTSGNDDIDKFIQDAQLSATNYYKVLEWIPYDKFYDITYIAKGGFGKVYRANWIDGEIWNWDIESKNWNRNKLNMDGFVALKSLNNSKNITLEFINEITLHHKVTEEGYDNFIIRLYGITQDLETENYMMVLKYAPNGSLQNYLDTSYNELSWYNKVYNLWFITIGLDEIHKRELIHRDLHIGNILHDSFACITDMGLSADIYSFGIIMYEVISGLPPYHDVSHDKDLAIKICQGLRPRFNIKVPQLVVHLIKRCLDANPLDRPTVNEILEILHQWYEEFSRSEKTELKKQIEEADKFNDKLQTCNTSLTSLSYETHSEAIYTSRLLNFNNLPEPKNSDDYYKQCDNIISTEYPDKKNESKGEDKI